MNSSSVSTKLRKVKTIRNWPTPTRLKEIQAFLGTVGYYQQYISNFAVNVRLLNWLTAKGAEWDWDESALQAFINMKEGLTTTGSNESHETLLVALVWLPVPAENGSCITQMAVFVEGAITSSSQMVRDIG